jgi:hypothetical protein
MRRHGSQAQGGAQTNAMGRHLVDAVLHRGKALRWRVAAGIHLIGQLLHQRLQLVELGIAGCKKKGISIKSWVGSKIRLQSGTVDGFQQLFALVLPLKLGYARFLGNVL